MPRPDPSACCRGCMSPEPLGLEFSSGPRLGESKYELEQSCVCWSTCFPSRRGGPASLNHGDVAREHRARRASRQPLEHRARPLTLGSLARASLASVGPRVSHWRGGETPPLSPVSGPTCRPRRVQRPTHAPQPAADTSPVAALVTDRRARRRRHRRGWPRRGLLTSADETRLAGPGLAGLLTRQPSQPSRRWLRPGQR